MAQSLFPDETTNDLVTFIFLLSATSLELIMNSISSCFLRYRWRERPCIHTTPRTKHHSGGQARGPLWGSPRRALGGGAHDSGRARAGRATSLATEPGCACRQWPPPSRQSSECLHAAVGERARPGRGPRGALADAESGKTCPSTGKRWNPSSLSGDEVPWQRRRGRGPWLVPGPHKPQLFGTAAIMDVYRAGPGGPPCSSGVPARGRETRGSRCVVTPARALFLHICRQSQATRVLTRAAYKQTRDQ